MRSIEVVGGGLGVTQFALPLHSLASGRYVIELIGKNGSGVASERLPFRVTG